SKQGFITLQTAQLSSRGTTVSIRTDGPDIRKIGFLNCLLFRSRERAVDHTADVHLPLHGVLFDRSVIGNRRLLPLDVEGKREVDGSAFQGAGEIGIAQLPDVFS